MIRNVLATVAAVAVLLAGTLSLHAAEPRIALVIGNSRYEVGALKNPVHDAADMAAALERLGFAVVLKKNARLQEMEEAVRAFGHRLKRGGVGLFFYAGHGIQIGGRNYLIPIDARIEKETDAKYRAIDVEMVLDEMANAGNPMNIVILDACRDNPVGRSLRSAGRGLAIISDAPKGTFITYSTSPGKTAADGEGRNSPYTSALLESIREPGLPIEQVFKRVRQRLSRETGDRQIPWELSSLQGDFYFTPGGAGAAAAPARRPPERPVPAPAGGASAGDRTFTSPALGAAFVLIPAGTFTMGSPADEPGRFPDETPHRVTISRAFYMQTTEVTQGQWKRIMGGNPSYFRECGDDCPVERVSWNEVQDFIRRLNQREGTDRYRLPTEAQWEYAARAGTETALYSGPLRIRRSNDAPDLDAVAWYKGNSCVEYAGGFDSSGWQDRQYSCPRSGTHPVGRKAPNAWGLYDMIGNVFEWVQDRMGDYPPGSLTDPEGPASGSARVRRGCSWGSSARYCRAAFRLKGGDPDARGDGMGFRLVRTP